MAENRTNSSVVVGKRSKPIATQGNTSIVLGDELLKRSSIHPNIAQEFVVTTADKIKISLIEHRAALKAQNDWVTPLGMLLALIPSLIATDFKQFLGIEPNVWQALFLLGSIGCFGWFIYAIIISIKLRKKSDIEYVIEQLKQPTETDEK